MLAGVRLIENELYACGANGIILKGRYDNWSQLSMPDALSCVDDLWGLASFQGSLYFCSYHRLFKMTNNEIIEITKEVNSAVKFYRLASNLSYLWVTTGTGKIFRFDQKQWLSLVWPDSV